MRQQRLRSVREPAISMAATGRRRAGVLAGLSHLRPGEVAIGAAPAGAVALRWPRLGRQRRRASRQSLLIGHEPRRRHPAAIGLAA